MYSSEDWQKLVTAFKQVADTDAGEIVLNYLSYQCFENRNTFIDNNEAMSNRNLGKREIVLLIRRWIACDSRKIPKTLKEKFDA